MRLPTLIVTVLLFVPSAFAATLHVPGDYSTIQGAIFASQNGDTIEVVPEIYYENLNFMGKAIVVKSQMGPELTIIDGRKKGAVVTFNIDEGADTVLDGFTLLNGIGSWHESLPGEWGYCGGGIYCKNASPTIINNIITNNWVEWGGGAVCIAGNASPLVKQNAIHNNRSGEYGGAIFSGTGSSPVIEANEIRLNQSDVQGGGIICFGCSPTIINNTLERNTADLGGGIYTSNCTNLTLSGNTIIGNLSHQFGGGIQCYNSTGTISLNSISENTQGGIGCEQSALTITTNTIFGNLVKGGIVCSFNSYVTIKDNILNQNMAEGDFSGGIWCGKNTTINHNIFYANVSEKNGGAIHSYGSSLITNNILKYNVAGEKGGGICLHGQLNAHEDISDNTFIENSAATGGGLWCDRSPYVIGNVFRKNAANEGGGVFAGEGSTPVLSGNTLEDNTATQSGGGVRCVSSSPVLSENRITGNTASSGAGISCNKSTSTISNNLIKDNLANVTGGGLSLTEDYSPVLSNNRIIDNKAQGFGGGLFFKDSYYGSVTNNTVLNNAALQKGGAMTSSFSLVTVTNTIFWNNTAPQGPQLCVDNSIFNISHSDLLGGQAAVSLDANSTLNWGGGIIDADPLFVNMAARDLHIIHVSPCRGAGLNTTVVDPCDFEGDPRIAASTVDMGADEFHAHFYCTGDFTPEGGIQGYVMGTPGAAPVGIFIGFSLLGSPLHHGWGDFYLASPWFLFGPLGSISSLGVMVLPAELPRLPEAPYDLYLQALVGNQLTNLFTLEVR